MKRTIAITIIILGLFSCNQTKKEDSTKPKPIDSTLTSGIIAVDVRINDYRAATLLRIVKDSVQMTVTDSSGGKITQEKKLVRDTSYQALWPFQVPDSTGKKAIKSKINPALDPTVLAWRIVRKEAVLQDFNKDWNKQ